MTDKLVFPNQADLAMVDKQRKTTLVIYQIYLRCIFIQICQMIQHQEKEYENDLGLREELGRGHQDNQNTWGQ